MIPCKFLIKIGKYRPNHYVPSLVVRRERDFFKEVFEEAGRSVFRLAFQYFLFRSVNLSRQLALSLIVFCVSAKKEAW